MTLSKSVLAGTFKRRRKIADTTDTHNKGTNDMSAIRTSNSGAVRSPHTTDTHNKGINTAHRFEIGTEYLSSGKQPRLCTVTDKLTTTNSAGEIVKERYISTHKVWEQTVTNHDVVDASVAMGVDRLEKLRAIVAKNTAS